MLMLQDHKQISFDFWMEAEISDTDMSKPGQQKKNYLLDLMQLDLIFKKKKKKVLKNQ